MRRRPALVLSTALLAAAALGAAVPAAAGDGADWVRVELADLPTTAQVEALLATGVDGLQYTAPRTYVAPATGDQVEALRRVDGVRQVSVVPAADRLGERVAGLTAPARLQVVAAPGTDLGAVRDAYDVTSVLRLAEVSGDAETAQRLARTPGVLHVDVAPAGLQAEDEGSGQVLAGAVTGRQPVDPGYRDFLAGLGLSGEGVVFSVADDGLDSSHPELAGRIVDRIEYGPTALEAEGHGTHVAGILGGKGAPIGPFGVREDARGLDLGLGVAPGVRFVDQPIIATSGLGGFPPDGGFGTVTGDAVRAGAVGWNASWTDGGGAGVGYVANAAVLDALVRDADTRTEGAQPFSLVFSAGNSGGPANKITSPKELKNGIVVASSRGHRAGDVDTISSFSSRGPARDGRIVPTITAPGETIASSRATVTSVSCNTPLAEGLGFYATCSGTSMASPQVAGSVALVHEWYGKQAGAAPSPALAKALLVNGAQDLKAPDVPNPVEGWGRVDLRRTFDPTTSRVLVDQSVVLSGRGDAHELEIEAVDPAKPLRVTVVWTDVPGPVGVSRALVNDLDLLVTGAGGAYAGNDFVDGESVAGGVPDRLNNVENVWLPTASGRYTVSVVAADLPADGVPGGTVTDQDFALVITNGRVVAP